MVRRRRSNRSASAPAYRPSNQQRQELACCGDPQLESPAAERANQQHHRGRLRPHAGPRDDQPREVDAHVGFAERPQRVGVATRHAGPCRRGGHAAGRREERRARKEFHPIRGATSLPYTVAPGGSRWSPAQSRQVREASGRRGSVRLERSGSACATSRISTHEITGSVHRVSAGPSPSRRPWSRRSGRREHAVARPKRGARRPADPRDP